MHVTRETGQWLFYILFLCLTATTVTVLYRFTNQASLWLHHAETLRLAGDLQAASPFYEKAFQGGLRSHKAVYRVVQMYLGRHDIATAARLAKEHILGTKRLPKYELSEFVGLFDANNAPQIALDLLVSRHAEVLAEDALALRLADFYRRLKRPDEAESVYRLLLSRLPQNRNATLGLAETIGFSGQRTEAERLCHEVLNRHPGDRGARFLLARLFTADGRFDQAVAEYKILLGEP